MHLSWLLIILGLTSALTADAPAKLPPVAELIRLAEVECKEYQQRNGELASWPLLELAEAKAHTGDYAGALQTAHSVNGVWAGFTAVRCWIIHFEQTGTMAKFPVRASAESDLDKEFEPARRLEVAKALARAGRMADAEAFLPRGQDTRSLYLLVEFHLSLADDELQQGKTERAAATLQNAWTTIGRLPDARKPLKHLETLASAWLRLDNRKLAGTATDLAVRLHRERLANKSPHVLQGRDWGRMARLQALLGRDQQAREAFAEALRLIEEGDRIERQEGFFEGWLLSRNYAECMGQVSAWQLASAMNREAVTSRDKALARINSIEDPMHHDGTLRLLVEAEAGEGNLAGALGAIDLMRTPYWKVLGYCHCAASDKLLERQAVAALLKQAEGLADAEPAPNHSTDMFVKIAEAHAKLGDAVNVQRCLDKAIKASRSTAANDHHPWIARAQIRLGKLEDAYATIQGISKPDDRTLPLAELAKEVAKRDALRTKQSGR